MVARTIGEVRTALADDRAGKAFASGFAEAYFGQAFGVLPKTQIDLLVFWLLTETGVIDGGGAIFAMARTLNVTPTKARNLLFQYHLRCIDEHKADAAVEGDVEARFGGIIGWLDGSGVDTLAI